MGRDKAGLLVDGVAMAARVAEALRAAGAVEVWAVGGDPAVLGPLGLGVVPDDEPGGGPLPATITALGHARTDIVVVLACDLLHPSAAVVRTLVAALGDAPPEVQAAVPLVERHRQWAHAAWRVTAHPRLQAARAAGAHSLRRGAGGLALVEVHGVDPLFVADADTPESLAGGSVGARHHGASLSPMDIPEIDAAELLAQRVAGAPLIDVREHEEFAAAHVPGAHHIPLGEVVERIVEVPTGGTVYVICARGSRSATAVAHYRAQGIDAVNVAGGTLAWIDAGHPTDTGAWRGTAGV